MPRRYPSALTDSRTVVLEPMLPAVCTSCRALQQDGIWEWLNDELRDLVRQRAGRNVQPSATIRPRPSPCPPRQTAIRMTTPKLDLLFLNIWGGRLILSALAGVYALAAWLGMRDGIRHEMTS